MLSLSRTLNTLLALLLALCLMVNCLPESESMKRDEIMKALAHLNDQNSYRLFRASRSNGKPTFIRFGKRSMMPSMNDNVDEASPYGQAYDF